MGLRAERTDGNRLDFRSSLVRNLSKIFWIGEMRIRTLGTKAEKKMAGWLAVRV